MTDREIREILKTCRSIAMIGASTNLGRPSNGVGRFLIEKGYEVHPVNPGHAGEILFGRKIVASIANLPAGIEMIDIFRRPEHVLRIVEEAIETLPDLRVVWMQLGVVHEGAAETARASGLSVVMDRCPKIDYARLLS
ncbi:CoA-binding protein [Palleronia sp. LCG004]|uniref:CoA-binding protein n=1 Tax=Palleronia sp. LCG004 TaxID=3079304 RepID=UPI0029435268|nr:CoA-binding protein [Palleronia sp. LCG004]WOI57277.1 CoA-binding protein [Palleronia sp. LCG004]